MSVIKDIVIVGGGSAGINCAIKTRKLDEKVNITLFDTADSIGSSPCQIPNYLAGEVSEEDIIGYGQKTLEQFFNITVKVGYTLTQIDDTHKLVSFKQKATNEIKKYKFDKLVLATGSSFKKLPSKSCDCPNTYYLYSAKEAILFKSSLDHTCKHILLVGGGVMNLEFASSLSKNYQITIVTNSEKLVSNFNEEMQQLIASLLTSNKVRVIYNRTVTSINANTAVLDSDEKIPFDRCLVAIGASFNKSLRDDMGLKTTPHGQILVDKNYQTNLKNVYACGDAMCYEDALTNTNSFSGSGLTAGLTGRDVAYNLVSKTNKQTLKNYKCFVTKVFDTELASIGTYSSSEKLVSFTLWHNPVLSSSNFLTIFLQFCPKRGTIIHCEGFGHNAGQAINQLAILMQIKNDIRLLGSIQQAYHPDINNVKTTLHQLSYIASSIMSGKVKHELPVLLKPDEYIVLDVRSPQEFATGSLPNAYNIPLPSLRENLTRLDASKHILVVCESGKRAYYASQILQAHNLSCTILSGGMKSYRLIKNKKGES